MRSCLANKRRRYLVFEVFLKLEANEDVVEEELAKNDLSDKSNNKNESFHTNNKNILKEFPVETYSLTTNANVNDKDNVKGEQKKENKISKIFRFVSPHLLTLTPTVLMMIACTRKYKNRRKLVQVSGWDFNFSSPFSL